MFFFTAEWCAPCQKIETLYRTLSLKPDYSSHWLFVKVDADENKETSESAGIRAMPTFQAYKNGVKVDEFVGASEVKLENFFIKNAF